MAANPNARLETFCDGVFAIALTLLVIDLKAPHLAHDVTSQALWKELAQLLPSVRIMQRRPSCSTARTTSCWRSAGA